MAKLQVLSKGKYLDPQPNQPVTLSQYIFAIQDKSKYLLLRFKNERAELLTGLKFAIKQLNAKGNEIETSVVECDDLKGAKNSLFTFNKKIEVKRDCADFKVFLISASYGKYVYSVKNHATYLSYNDAVTVNRMRSEDIFRRIGNSDRMVTVRKLKKPIFSVFMAILAIVMVASAAIVQTVDYKSSTKNFTLYNINYKIVSGKQIMVTGYRGDAVTVTIPESIEGYKVVSMKEEAFANNSKIKKVVINAAIEIASGAFQNCDNLTTVELTKVTKIGDYAFEGCASLKSVSAENLDAIGANAFEFCPKLKTVDIANKTKVLKIGINAFANCESLELVKIDQTINYSYNVQIFENSTIEELYLKNIANRPLQDCFGYYNASVTKLTVGHADNIPANFLNRTYVKSLTFERLTTTRINDRAFKDNGYLEEIKFNTPITEIGAEAFANTSLKAFDFKGVVSIGTEAFMGCASLESVDLSSSNITNLPEFVFSGCHNLKTLKLSTKITAIEQFAFSDCRSLEEVTIPSNVATMGLGVFYGCNSLKKMTTYYIGGSITENTFMGYLFMSSASGEVYAPNSLKQISITASSINVVPQGAFYGFAGLEKVTFASPIQQVEYRAFYGCSSLKDFPFSESLLLIEDEAFYNSGFTAVTIPASVNVIGDRAFAESSSLKTMVVPTTVESIGEHFIGNCANLEEIVVPYIGRNILVSSPLSDFTASSPLSKLTSITVTDDEYTVVADYAFANATALTSINLPSTIVSIGDYAFNRCESLENLTLPSTVTEIGYSAFADTSLKNFSVPNLVTAIEGETFKNCIDLRIVTIPQNVESIGADAFDGCLYLHEVYNYSPIEINVGGTDNGYIAQHALVVYDDNDAPVPKVISGAYEFLRVDGKWILAYCHDEVKNVNLPSQVEYQGATASRYSILDYTFMNMVTIESVAIPSGVTSIGDYAFYSCTNLSSVSIETGNLNSIGERAFYECYNLEDFDFVSSLSSIGVQAFYNCSSLTEINLSGNITEIEYETFYNCASVQSIVLPSLIQTIGERAFLGCQYVLNIVLPSRLSDIGEDAFEGNVSMMSVWNKSSNITLSMGSSSYGEVAKYAKTIKTAGQQYTFEVFTDGNYQVINDNGQYWIYKFTGSIGSDSLLKLPETITHNGSTVTRFSLSKDTFNGLDYFNLYVPTSVKTLDDRVFDYSYPSTVYYASNRTSWESLTRNINRWFTVYYYSPCNHTGEYWKYDNSGNITTAIDQPTYSSVVAPTCKEDGYSRWDCPYCAYYLTQTDYALGHSFGSNGQCIRCTAKKVKITAQNINSYTDYIVFNLGSSFTVNEYGEIKSTNTAVGSTASMSISIKVSGVVLEFSYGASSNTTNNYATLVDYEIGTYNHLTYTSWHYHEYSRTGTIRFTYTCGSPYYSSDYGYISGIYVILPY